MRGIGAPLTAGSRANPSLTCVFNPASVIPSGAAVTSTLTISTNTQRRVLCSSLRFPPREETRVLTQANQLTISAASLSMICGLGFTSRKTRRNWARYLDLIAFLAAIAGTLSGCCDGGSASTKTPPGQYPLTITGTSGSLTHSVTYNVTVN